MIRDGDAVVARTELGRPERVVARRAPRHRADRRQPARPGVEDGDRSYGRGTADMKGGVAVQLQARGRRSPSPSATSPTSSTTTRRSRPSATASAGSRAATPDWLAGRLRRPDGADQRARSRAAARAPCGPRCATRGDRAHSRAVLDGRNADPRGRRRCWPGWRRTSRARSRSTGLRLPRGPERRRHLAAASPATSSRTSAWSRSTTGSRPTGPWPRRAAHVREVFDGLRGRRSPTRAGGARPGLDRPAAAAFVAAVGGAAAAEVRLDRRRPVQRARRPRGQLRPGRPERGARRRRARARWPSCGLRAGAAELARVGPAYPNGVRLVAQPLRSITVARRRRVCGIGGMPCGAPAPARRGSARGRRPRRRPAASARDGRGGRSATRASRPGPSPGR